MKFQSCVVSLLLCGPISVMASVEDFPQGAAAPTATELSNRLAGKSFHVQLKNGISWRLQYNNVGYFFVDTSNGRSSSGTWIVEDGRLCTQVKGRDTPRQCSDVRIHQDQLIVRRTVDGELITFVPR